METYELTDEDIIKLVELKAFVNSRLAQAKYRLTRSLVDNRKGGSFIDLYRESNASANTNSYSYSRSQSHLGFGAGGLLRSEGKGDGRGRGRRKKVTGGKVLRKLVKGTFGPCCLCLKTSERL